MQSLGFQDKIGEEQRVYTEADVLGYRSERLLVFLG
jgi:hypothetical protein